MKFIYIGETEDLDLAEWPRKEAEGEFLPLKLWIEESQIASHKELNTILLDMKRFAEQLESAWLGMARDARDHSGSLGITRNR